MQEPTMFAGMPLRGQQRTQSVLPGWLATLLVSALTLALVIGGLFWMQWSSQRAITLGYPTPQVHITSLNTSTVSLNENVQFAANGIGRDITYEWDFGDGSYAEGPVVSHAYQQLPGQNSNFAYTVYVTVIDGLDRTSYDSTTIHVLPPPPTVTFTATEETYYYGTYNQVVDFNASSSVVGTSTATYNWNFGDGNSDPNGSPTERHYYYYPQQYTVTLVITDAAGQTGQYQTTIYVQ